MNIRPLFNVIGREFKNIFTAADLLMICFAAPIFYGLLFSFLYVNKRASEINIGIINTDNSAMSRKLVRYLDASPELKVNKTFASSYEAYYGIFRNDLSAFYFIPGNFSAELKKGKSASVFNAANSSNFLVSSSVLKKLPAVSSAFSEKQFTKLLVDKGYSYKAAKNASNPLRADARYIFNTQMNYSDFFLFCLILAVLQQILLVAVCSSMSSEKSKKTLRELYKTAESSFPALYLGKAFPYIVIGFFLQLLYIFALLPMNAIIAKSVLPVLAVSLFFIIAVVFFGMMISAFFDSPEISLAVLMFYALPTFLLSGFAWPHSALPPLLKAASYLFPSTYAVNPIRLFILGDIPFRYAVAPALCLAVFAAICFAISCLYTNKEIKTFRSLKNIKKRF